jgi:hypothetical protein
VFYYSVKNRHASTWQVPSALVWFVGVGYHRDVVKNGGKITLAAIQSSSQVVKTFLL